MTAWTVRVEWEQAQPMRDSELEMAHLSERVGSRAIVIRVEKPTAGQPWPETWSACLTIEAGSLREATYEGLNQIEEITRSVATGIEVLAESAHARRAHHQLIPELVGYAEIAELAGVSRQRARQIAQEVIGFPTAVAETATGPLRIKDQVLAWLATWERKPGRPRGNSA